MEEFVVLVDGDDNEIGTMPKALVHQAETPLHRAFSFFLFNSKGELLLQQRSSRKKTWPLVWSNSCCGHPLPGEERKDAVKRRLKDELGLTGIEAEEAAPYRYC
ncbi:MAG TPA: isopentenyl-diphosphate Delta-isomerase, partial [Candidatus Paceibacterota bacterium]